MATPPVLLEDTSENIPPIVSWAIAGALVAAGAYLAYRDWHLAFRRLGFLFASVGALVVLYMARAVSRARRSISWPVVDGTVVRSEVVTETMGNGITTYDPEVSFEYDGGRPAAALPTSSRCARSLVPSFTSSSKGPD